MNLAEVIVGLFIAFLGIVAGTLAMGQDLFAYSRIIIILAAGVGCVIIAIVFQRMTTPKKYPTFLKFKEPSTKRQKIKEFTLYFLLTFDLLFCFAMPLLTWQFAWIANYTMVITYWDALMIGIFIVGVYLVRFIVKAYRSKDESD